MVRILVASRVRPVWIPHRRVLYREAEQIGRSDLAMDEVETKLMIGPRSDLDALVTHAEGWPAVLALAVGTGRIRLPGGALPAELYAFIAEELFQSVPDAMQQQLLRLAIAPEVTENDMPELFGDDAAGVIQQARDVGFLSTDKATELHPLVRDFLLRKLTGDRQGLVRTAVLNCVERRCWDRAFELVLRFELVDLVEPVLEEAYRPLARCGHLETLSTFATGARSLFSSSTCPAIIDLVDAEVASRDGAYPLAVGLATRVRSRLLPGHILASQASAIVGRCAFSQADLEVAESAFRTAHETASDDQDEAEALYGWALTSIQGEIGDPAPVLEQLAHRRRASALDLVRWGSVEVARRRFSEGLAKPLALEESIHALAGLEDPRARSSLTFSLAYVFALMSNYQEALELASEAQADVEAFDLEFARPYSNSNLAFIYMGLRRFGAAEGCLQLVEDASSQRPTGSHILNARILRCRMALQTGELDRARQLVEKPANEVTIPSLHGEFLATQALAHAVTGNRTEASALATAASKRSRAVEVQVMATAARAVGATEKDREAACGALFDCATRFGTWDPVVTALRCSRSFSDVAASLPNLRSALETPLRTLKRSCDCTTSRNSLALAQIACGITHTS